MSCFATFGTLQDGGVYSFRSVSVSGEYLDLAGSKTDNGNDLQTWPINFTAAQQFKAVACEIGGFYLAHVNDDKKVVDKSKNSSWVGIWDAHSGDNQMWNLVYVGKVDSNTNNEYAIVNQSSQTAITANGSKAKVTGEPFNASSVPTNQRWKVHLES